jgi:hypothetical protein
MDDVFVQRKVLGLLLLWLRFLLMYRVITMLKRLRGCRTRRRTVVGLEKLAPEMMAKSGGVAYHPSIPGHKQSCGHCTLPIDSRSDTKYSRYDSHINLAIESIRILRVHQCPVTLKVDLFPLDILTV